MAEQSECTDSPDGSLPVEADRSSARDAAAPTLRVEIRILDDGRVVFGDLTPELAEVAAILNGGDGLGPTWAETRREATR